VSYTRLLRLTCANTVVVNSDGSDVDASWVGSSIIPLALNIEKEKKKGNGQGQAKTKETAAYGMPPIEFDRARRVPALPLSPVTPSSAAPGPGPGDDNANLIQPQNGGRKATVCPTTEYTLPCPRTSFQDRHQESLWYPDPAFGEIGSATILNIDFVSLSGISTCT
jgi:hypothetical protein